MLAIIIILRIGKNIAHIESPACSCRIFYKLFGNREVKIGKNTPEICHVKFCGKICIFFKELGICYNLGKSAKSLTVCVIIEKSVAVIGIIQKIFIGDSDFFGIGRNIGGF